MSEKKYNTGGQIDFMDLINRGLQSQLNPEVLAKQRRQQGVISGMAGIADTISGNIGQRQAEGDIERFGAEADAIRDQMRDMKAPSIMSPENQAAAVRNATILGAGRPQEDSSELAAAKMAMDAGADPANIQRALTEAEAQKDATARAEQQGAFREGLGYAHQDAMSDYQRQMQNLGMDYDENQRALEMAQNQSLAAQQQKQGGFSNLARGATQFLSSGGVDAIGKSKGYQALSNLFGNKNKTTTGTGGAGMFGAKDTPFGTGGLKGTSFLDKSIQGQGLSQVQKLNMLRSGRSPDTGPQGIFPTGINDLIGNLNTLSGPYSVGLGQQTANPPIPYNNAYAQGGAVQATPGAFKHDDGDGIYEEGENEMSLVRHMAGGKVEDTGIRLTGGEYVINPKQSSRTKKAYERIKKVLARKKDPSRADYKALYEALNFLDDPQFNNVD